MMDGVTTAASRYGMKADPYSSHSVILAWLGEGHGRRLLDVGAADGFLSRHFTERGWRVTALEADARAAAAGRAQCERMILADLDRDRPALDATFEAVVCGDVLEHLADPEATLAWIAGLLVPSGRVALSVPNVAHLWIRLSLLAGRFDYAERGILDRTHLRFFTARSLGTLVAAAGLRVIRATATPVPLHEVVPARWHSRALDAVHAASAAGARALPRLLGYQLLVLAERAR